MIFLFNQRKNLGLGLPFRLTNHIFSQSSVLTLTSIVFYYKIIYKSFMKYLIKLWDGDHLINTLEWESTDEDKLYQEVAESVPKPIRATIENDKRENKTTR